MRKIVMSGLVAAAALLGCAGPAFAGTFTTGTAGTAPSGTAPAGTAGTVTTGPAIARAVAGKSAAARIAASYLERLSAARQRDSGGGIFELGGSGLSCASPTACLSVGMTIDTSSSISSPPMPLVERLHARTWKPVPVKTPKGAVTDVLSGVSCKAATYCLVVGDALSTSGNGGFTPYALTWNGTTLTPAAAPPVPKADAMGLVTSVSCVAVKSCVAIGVGASETTGDSFQFVWTFKGTKWALTSVLSGVPSSAGTETDTEYTGLHCLSLTSCVLIGDSIDMTGDNATDTPVAATWNGTTFTDLKAPVPSGVIDATFSGVSCVSSRSCAVVGSGSTNSQYTDSLGFAEVWNGKTWAVTKWAGVKGDTQTFLTSVSCTSAVRCIAVGTHGTDKTGAPAALALGGTKWTVLKVPGAGTGRAAVFESVSCPVNGQCVTTGEIGKTNSASPATTPIAGYWNGRVWKYGPM